MLAACPYSNHFEYTPQRSFPLSMRDANAHPQSSTYTNPKSTSLAVAVNTPFSQRSIRSNPLIAQTREKDNRRTQQRSLFLKRVRQDGEERKWQSRSEELLRLDFVSMEKRWRADLARVAPVFTDEPDEEVKDCLVSSESEHRDDCMVEDAMRLELQELDGLLSMMETQGQQEGAAVSICHSDHEDDTGSTVYGGDDDDYESLFMDVIQQDLEMGQQSKEPWGEKQRLADDMDISGG
ncbi:MAG: hypothetical protein M1812_007490 [Candelaria pacifica]|nr:MAG: hypothetical protein M1812_007490 [Candelaria pacifica]